MVGLTMLKDICGAVWKFLYKSKTTGFDKKCAYVQLAYVVCCLWQFAIVGAVLLLGSFFKCRKVAQLVSI